MSRRIEDVEAIFADITGVYAGARRIGLRADVLAQSADSLREQRMPEMPGNMVSRVAAGLMTAAGAADRMVRQIDEELKLLQARMKRLQAAVEDDQKTNMSRAQDAFERFVTKHDSAFDVEILPGLGLPVDGGSFVKGFGGSVLGAVDIAQLAVRNRYGDDEAAVQIHNIGTSIRRDPQGALKAIVSYDLLTKTFGRGSTGQERHEAFSELAGGIGFDALVASLTGGAGAAASRANKGLNASRQGAAKAADVELKRAEQGSARTQSALRSRTEELARASRITAAAADEISFGSLVGDAFRLLRGRPTKLGEVGRAAGMESLARRQAAEAARERDAALSRLTAQEVVFKDAQKKLRQIHIDTSGLKAAATQVNKIGAAVGAGVPTSAKDALQSLLQAMSETNKDTASKAPSPSSGTFPKRLR